MPLDAGTQLGPYEILAEVGHGGMGVVCTVQDPRLDRGDDQGPTARTDPGRDGQASTTLPDSPRLRRQHARRSRRRAVVLKGQLWPPAR